MGKTGSSCDGSQSGRRYGIFECKGISRSDSRTESMTDSTTESSENSSIGTGGSSSGSFAEGREPPGAAVAGIVSSSTLLGWPLRKLSSLKSSGGIVGGGKKKVTRLGNPEITRTDSEISEMDVMKERIAKLLLGEDMSGSGKGVCPALAISNAITNLSGTVLGQLGRLEPLPCEKKSMWRREMECLLCVSDHIVELIPSFQTFPDGTKLEVMNCRQRSDLFIGLPALRKLDNMLLEILDGFGETEFWYVDQGIITPDCNGSASFNQETRHGDEKWWLPVPRLPPDGLTENTRKRLNQTREFANQILKASMAINSIALAEMEVPESYLDSLPKNGKSCLGEVLYRQITSDRFSAELVLGFLDLSSEEIVLDVVNRVEASTYIWRRRTSSKPQITPYRSGSKSSWEIVKDRIIDGDRRDLLADRAQSLLLCLKQRFPCLRQTALDTSKIQFNKDVGKSILESYSRVLESMAYNIVTRIEELIYVDNLHKTTSNLNSVPLLGTPYRTPSFSTPSFSPFPHGERMPFLTEKNGKERRAGGRVRRVLANYLGADSKSKVCIRST